MFHKLTALATLALTTSLSADTLLLRNGKTMNGSYLGGDTRTIRFATAQVQTYDLNDVTSLEFGGSQQSAGGFPSASASTPAATRKGKIYPWTQIIVRLTDPVDSSRDRLGQTYRASLDAPISCDGAVLFPRGSDAVLTLVNDERVGHFAGRTALTLTLTSLSLGDQVYYVAANPVTQVTNARGGQSLGTIGGITALGAAIGGLAGGGRAAGIGGIAGAGAGTATAASLSGQRIKLPTETRLTFTLREALSL